MLYLYSLYLKPFKSRLCCLFIAVIFLFLVFPVSVSAWETTVDKVHDGDTIEVSSNGRMFNICLYGIDCPEKDQPFGMKAKRYVSRMCKGKNS